MKLPELHNPFIVADKNKDHFLIISSIICGIMLFCAVVLSLAMKPIVIFGIVAVVTISRVLYAVFKGR